MSKVNRKMLINVDQPEECRAVVIENGKLDEIIVEHSSHELVKGNIYLGVVTRVEPAIEAAFVDIGKKKYGFLPFKDVLPESYLQTGEKKARTRIQDVMIRGQKLLVQVVKESRDAKGPSLTNAVTIPGRFLVLMVSSDSSGISRKIEDEAERKKIKQLMSDLGVPASMGVIIRTAGVGRTKTELQKDIQALLKIWETIEKKFVDSNTPAPSLLYEGPDMVVRTVRDHFSNDMTEVFVDNKESFDSLNEFMRLVMPRMRNRIKFYQDTKPLFSQYNVEEQIESIYNRRVELPSGGSIIIDVGEAMVSIDVNSGRTTSASALEETAIKTNLEAAEEITRQLRLRDLGGLIVIDFIDMFQKKNKALLEKQVKQFCKRDRARINISRISRFGLLEMSRQRLAPPVKEGFFSDCQHCGGTGHVKTDSSSALSVIRKIQEHLAAGNVKILQVKVSTQVSNYLLNKKMKALLDLKEKNGVEIQFESQDFLPFESFAFTVLERKKEEDKVIEQKSSIPRDSKPDEEASEEKGVKRGRGRRPSSGRGRGRRASSTARERKKEESKSAEQKSGIQENSQSDGAVSVEEKGEKDTRVRRPSSGRGRGRRPSTGGRPRTRRPARQTKSKSWKSSGTKTGAVSESENVSSTGESSGGNISSVRDSGDSAPSHSPKAEPERESNEERQPMENVSRLHEMVTKNPLPFDPDANRK